MTILLVLFTFLFFIFLVSRRKVSVTVAPRIERTPIAIPAPTGGFHMPDNLRYHPSHTWALAESPTLARVGLDEFASKLIGKIDSIKLPLRNTWVQQGHRLATIIRGGKTVTLFSPVEGVVSDVNDAAILDPEAARKQPYGDGWLIVVQTPDQKSNFRNLFTGGLAKRWMEDIVSRLNPIMAQDGGEAVDDFAMASGRDWEATIREFMLN